jgi:hypothetical protein
LIEEKDPNGLDAKVPGAKLDAGKIAVHRGLYDYFPRALMAVADISTIGAAKYSWGGWRHVADGYLRYSDALGRHLLAEQIEGKYDTQTSKLHAAHLAWNALARLELLLQEEDKCK